MNWPTVKLGEILFRRKDETTIQPLKIYKRLTIRMNGRGVVVRDEVIGNEIGTKTQFIAHAGQLALSKIDARNGAFGVVPQECDSAIITGNFWVFDVDHARLDIRYLDWLTKTSLFVDFCIRASEGTTNRLYLQEPKFLSQEIPLPSLPEQHRIVTRIEELSAKIEEARGLRQQAVEEAEAFGPAVSNALFETNRKNGWPLLPLGEVADIRSGVTLGRTLNGPTVRLPYLRVANVQDGHLDLRIIKEVDVLESEAPKWQLQSGDVLLTEGGDWDKLGRGTVWRGEISNCIHQNHIFRVRTDSDKFDSDFVAAVISSPYGKEYFQAASKQTTNLASINQTQLKAFMIFRPPLSEQRRIVAYFANVQTKVDAVKTLQEETAEELNALTPSILSRAFSGELQA